MFESLQQGLQSAIKSLRGKGKITEANMREGLRAVEQSLLEADASYEAVQSFMDSVTQKALGQKVLLALDPSQQLVGIVHQELVELLGPVDPSMHLRSEPGVVMLCGLQGSGKTTTCGKLAKLILDQGKRPFMVAADLQRPAAIEQLHVLGEQLGVSVYSEEGATDPIKVCRDAVAKAKGEGVDVVLLDTAGRLAIDQELMEQLKSIDRGVQPDQAYLVVDGMTGQDAVNSAKAFNEALELDGVIMTKLDGDARGGALLSVKHVTGVPIKYIGTGEQLESLEPFRPEGMAGRILGMGDMVALVHETQRAVDMDKQKQIQEDLERGQFTLEHFRDQMQQLSQPGLMQRLMSLMPGMGQLREIMGDADTEGGMSRLTGIINSMTPAERKNPKLIEPSRRNRIAKGAGVPASEVSQLLKQFDGMASMMKGMAGKSMSERMQAVQELQKSGMLNPGGKLAKKKQSTGKRLSAKEKARAKKERQRKLKKIKKEKRRK